MLIQTKNPNYVRDTHSRALLPNDKKIVEEYKVKKKLFDENRQAKDEINNLKDKIEKMETSLEEIKSLLIKAIK